MAQFKGKGSKPRPLSVPREVRDANHETIFGKKPPRVPFVYVPPTEENKMTPSVAEMKKGTCGCGRSPTGNCCGWHGLSEEEFQHRKELYETNKVDLSGKEL